MENMRKMFAVCKKRCYFAKYIILFLNKNQIVELKTVDIIRCLIRI